MCIRDRARTAQTFAQTTTGLPSRSDTSPRARSHIRASRSPTGSRRHAACSERTAPTPILRRSPWTSLGISGALHARRVEPECFQAPGEVCSQSLGSSQAARSGVAVQSREERGGKSSANDGTALAWMVGHWPSRGTPQVACQRLRAAGGWNLRVPRIRHIHWLKRQDIPRVCADRPTSSGRSDGSTNSPKSEPHRRGSTAGRASGKHPPKPRFRPSGRLSHPTRQRTRRLWMPRTDHDHR
jgi:hypothetical protein